MPVPISKIKVGDFFSSSHKIKETTSQNVVTAVTASINANTNQIVATVTTSIGTFVQFDDQIVLSSKNGQGMSLWVSSGQ